MNNYNTDLKILLGVNDNNIKITGVEDVKCTKQSTQLLPKILFKIVHAKVEYPQPKCNNCGVKGCAKVLKNGSKLSRIKLQKCRGKATYLHLTKQRYYCKNCNKYTTAKTTVTEGKCTISLELKREVISRLTLESSRKSIARECKISDTTVYNIQKELYNSLSKRPSTRLPEYLCFDEFRATKDVEGHLSFIYCDALNHKVIDILTNNRKSTIIDHFKKRYTFKDRLNVKMVCMDMNAGYMAMVKVLFPNASVIIDRFHIIQAFNNTLNNLRTRVMRRFKDNDNDRIYKQFKRYWKLLLKREDDVPSDDYGRKYHFKQWITSRKIVEHLIKQDNELKEAYYTVQMLLDAYDTHDFTGFFDVINLSKTTIAEEFSATFKTFIKNKKYIENALRYNLSNGPIEGIINKVKNIKRTSYGYRNFFSLKARVLIIFNLGYSNTDRINKDVIDYSINIA
ncbi:ISL3 family transposase [Gemella massiliensis]|nr:ISL3 family transposase [Gemella massiliensis]